jgi:hypothetical protein
MGAKQETIDLILQSRADLDGFKKTREEINNLKSGFADLNQSVKTGFGIDISRRLLDGVNQAFHAIKASVIGFNADIEQNEVAFRTLLGNAEAAKVRINELYKFAAETPFEFGEVVSASRILQALTGNALSSGAGLRLVGDAASAVGTPLREASEWIGRLYSGLKSGTPVGIATEYLLRMGLVSGTTKRELDSLGESGGAMTNTMEVMQRAFGKTSGAMELQAKTFNGALSTLKDNLRSLAAENGKFIFEDLKLGIQALNAVAASKQINDYFESLRTLLDALSIVGPLGRFAGGVSGGDVGASNAANITAQTQALEIAIRKTIKSRRDAGELDADEAARLAKQLRLIEGVADAQDRLRRATDMASNLSRGKPLPNAASRGLLGGDVTPEAIPLTDAQKKMQDDLEKGRLEAFKSGFSEREQLEIDYINKLEEIEATFAGRESERQEARLAVDRIFDAKRRDFAAKNADEAEKNLIEMLDKTAAYRRELQQREIQQDAERLRIQRDSIAVSRSLLDADFKTADSQKRGPRLDLLRKEQYELDEAIKKLKEKRDLEMDRGAHESINHQVLSLERDRRGVESTFAVENAKADPNSMSQQFTSVMTDLKNQWGTIATQMAQSFESVFNSAIQTISTGITGLIMGTLTWEQALSNIGVTILTDIVQAIVQMGVRWILTKILMATVGKAIEAASLAATVGMAAGYSAAWAVPATLATIATEGEAALQAPGFIAIAEGITMGTALGGFARGGYTGTGNTSQIAGPVHRDEYVIPSPVLHQYGTDFFDRIMTGPGGFDSAMRSGFDSGAMSKASPAHPADRRSTSVFNFGAFSSRSEAERFLSSHDGERFLVDLMKRTNHEVNG